MNNEGLENYRICLVNLEFELTKSFPYGLKNKQIVKEKIISALEIAKKNNALFICFPELSFDKIFIPYVKEYNDMIVICGSYYDELNFNKSLVIIKGKEFPIKKINPSPLFEEELIEGIKMMPGDDLKIFGSENGDLRFGILICMDYYSERLKLYNFNYNKIRGVNLIFIPSINDNLNRFQKVADSDCDNFKVDIIKTCNAREKSVVFGRYHNGLRKRLIDEGLRDDDRYDYKIFEMSGEKIIIFDIAKKYLEIPIPLGGKPRFKLIKILKHNGKQWN